LDRRLKKLLRTRGDNNAGKSDQKIVDAGRRLRSEKQRQRRFLLADLLDRYNKEQLVINSERQLAGLVVEEDTCRALERLEEITPEHLLLIDAVLTLPKTSFENEMRRRIAAVNAITAYCGVEEGPASRRTQRGRLLKDNSPPVVKVEEPNVALSQAILSIKRETRQSRPTKCFVCLGNPSLVMRKRVKSYATPGSLSRHFLGRHVNKLKDGACVECGICYVTIENQIALLVYAERFHGTVSRAAARLVRQI
jgi:hypothetical protein